LQISRKCKISIFFMPGKAFQSKLEPHWDLIMQMRQRGKTLREICEQLETLGCKTTIKNVSAFLKRKIRRPHALGMGPHGQPPLTKIVDLLAPCPTEDPINN
jgi:hypothetical protein